MIRPLTLVVVLLLLPATARAQAQDTANIRACVDAVRSTTGRVVDEFDVSYQRRLLQTNFARWPGIVCEVGSGTIWALTIDGAPVVVQGWPSAQAKATFDALDAETAEAIRTLDARRQILAQRLAEAQAQLRSPGADAGTVSAYVRDGIGKALGQ